MFLYYKIIHIYYFNNIHNQVFVIEFMILFQGTPLHIAVEQNKIDIIKLLLNDKRININAKNWILYIYI